MAGKDKDKGPKRRVFISNVECAPAANEGEFTFKVFLGITVTVKESVPVRVWINGKYVGVAEVAGRTEKEYTIKLDLKKDQDVVEVKIEDITSKDMDRFEIPAAPLKKSAKTTSTPAKSPKRIEVRVGMQTPDGGNPVTIITKDDVYKPATGHVAITCGQDFEMAAWEAKKGWAKTTHDFSADVTVDNGRKEVFIFVKATCSASFRHDESNETVNNTLVKVPVPKTPKPPSTTTP